MLKDIESILVGEEEIKEICSDIAKKINEDYRNSKKKLVLMHTKATL